MRYRPVHLDANWGHPNTKYGSRYQVRKWRRGQCRRNEIEFRRARKGHDKFCRPLSFQNLIHQILRSRNTTFYWKLSARTCGTNWLKYGRGFRYQGRSLLLVANCLYMCCCQTNLRSCRPSSSQSRLWKVRKYDAGQPRPMQK